jgi:hypothetical protein
MRLESKIQLLFCFIYPLYFVSCLDLCTLDVLSGMNQGKLKKKDKRGVQHRGSKRVCAREPFSSLLRAAHLHRALRLEQGREGRRIRHRR